MLYSGVATLVTIGMRSVLDALDLRCGGQRGYRLAHWPADVLQEAADPCIGGDQQAHIMVRDVAQGTPDPSWNVENAPGTKRVPVTFLEALKFF